MQQQTLEELRAWMNSARFQDTSRPYSAEDVWRLRSPLCPTYQSQAMASKFWSMQQRMRGTGEYSLTYGALDPVQVVEMSKSLTSIYVSGWQCSSTASTTNEPGPDLADYPYTTVPNKVDQLFRAQDFHATRQRQAGESRYDYYAPIIADADTGHGGMSAVMRLTKLFIEAGAAGAHLEGQDSKNKKCGHQAGKVLVSTREHVNRLVAMRLQADIMGVEFNIVARTDAEAAGLLDNNVDPRDHPFILGCTNRDLEPLGALVLREFRRGAAPDRIAQLQAAWMRDARLQTYKECVEHALRAAGKPAAVLEQWRRATCWRAEGLSVREMRSMARELGVDPHWDMEKPRTQEGFFRVRGGLEYGIARAAAFAPHADLLWMETKKPNLAVAREFATRVRKCIGGDAGRRQLLAYNLSPSFNWDAAGMTDAEMGRFTDELGKLGFTWQFITLAGFHTDALITARFSRDFARRKMLAYVETIQRKERDEKVATLTHQTWSGAQLIDAKLRTVTGGLVSTTASGKGSTESQFKAKL